MTPTETIRMESAISQEFLRIVSFINDFKTNLRGTAKLNVSIQKTCPFTLEIYVGNFVGFNTPPHGAHFYPYWYNKHACKTLRTKVENMLKDQQFQVKFEDAVVGSITYTKVF